MTDEISTLSKEDMCHIIIACGDWRFVLQETIKALKKRYVGLKYKFKDNVFYIRLSTVEIIIVDSIENVAGKQIDYLYYHEVEKPFLDILKMRVRVYYKEFNIR